MGVPAINTSPAQMIGQPRGIGPFHQALEFFQMLPIQRFGRTEIHGNTVLHDLVLLEDLIENMKRPPAIHHEILRDDLEPIHHGLPLEYVTVMRHPKSNANSVICKSVKLITGHNAKN